VPGDSGGGATIALPTDPQAPAAPIGCNLTVAFWNYTHASTVAILNTHFTGNMAGNASGTLASGGGLSLGPGGTLRITGSSFVNNSALMFGGAIALGHGGSPDTCGLDLGGGTTFSGNTAAHGGAAVYMGCSADMFVDNSYFDLGTNGSQVGAQWFLVLVVGNVRSDPAAWNLQQHPLTHTRQTPHPPCAMVCVVRHAPPPLRLDSLVYPPLSPFPPPFAPGVCAPG
jgi:predicted outer membrane repeat protein